MDGLSWKTLLKWVIWGYHYFWNHPYIDILSPTIKKSLVDGYPNNHTSVSQWSPWPGYPLWSLVEDPFVLPGEGFFGDHEKTSSRYPTHSTSATLVVQALWFSLFECVFYFCGWIERRGIEILLPFAMIHPGFRFQFFWFVIWVSRFLLSYDVNSVSALSSYRWIWKQDAALVTMTLMFLKWWYSTVDSVPLSYQKVRSYKLWINCRYVW